LVIGCAIRGRSGEFKARRPERAGKEAPREGPVFGIRVDALPARAAGLFPDLTGRLAGTGLHKGRPQNPLNHPWLQRSSRVLVSRGKHVEATAEMGAALREVGTGQARVLADMAREQAVATR